MMFTRGEFDIAVIAELPDQSTGMGLTMAVQASGAFTKMTVLEELNMKQIVPVAQKAGR